MKSWSLQAQDVGFHYGRNRASAVLDGFTWTVPSGQTTLLLGPNGAGKSTLLKLLCGFERPTRGEISVNGKTGRDALYESVGWMPQDVQPARGLTTAEQVEYAAWVAGASHRAARTLAAEALEAVDLSDEAGTRTDRISGGQLRRVGLAQALVRQSPVLLLDEPTAGLDPAQALNFRRILAQLDRPGGIVISTHQVADLEDDVDRVAVLDRGSLRFDGTVAQFRALGTEDGNNRTGSLAAVFASMIGGGGRH